MCRDHGWVNQFMDNSTTIFKENSTFSGFDMLLLWIQRTLLVRAVRARLENTSCTTRAAARSSSERTGTDFGPASTFGTSASRVFRSCGWFRVPV